MPTTSPNWAPALACVRCGRPAVVSRSRELTVKQRPKFGLAWLLATLLTGGLALVAWLVWPRHRVVVGVDRWSQCSSCGARQ